MTTIDQSEGILTQPRPAEGQSPVGGSPVVQKVAIIVVHGVQPHPRYEIQDMCATNLVAQLNSDTRWKTVGNWVKDPINLPDVAAVKTFTPAPRTTRVYVETDDPAKPDLPYFDLIEAYWSPLDKGHVTFRSVAGWLLRSLFVPLNTAAAYGGKPEKARRDFAFITIAFAATIALLVLSLLAALKALSVLAILAGKGGDQVDWSIALDPARISNLLVPRAVLLLVAGFVGAYLLAQAARGFLSLIAQRGKPPDRPNTKHLRITLSSLVALGGAVLLVISAVVPSVAGGFAMSWWALMFVLSGAFFQSFRALAESFFVNFFQDVQIYTTRDENSDFYAMRETILSLVTTTLLNACDVKANDGEGYDRVHLLGHSLGSTIAMDALMRAYNVCQQAPEELPLFDRIRSFVTFGTALEKTKYFFDLTNPSPSLALDQWRNDVYGCLFTDRVSALDGTSQNDGIFWANYWYEDDPICDEIDSYRSFMPPGIDIVMSSRMRAKVPVGFKIGRLVCHNEQGSQSYGLPDVIPHGRYLLDDWFWTSDATAGHIGALEIVARWDAAKAAAMKAKSIKPTGAGPTTFSPTYETVDAQTALRYSDRY